MFPRVEKQQMKQLKQNAATRITADDSTRNDTNEALYPASCRKEFIFH